MNMVYDRTIEDVERAKKIYDEKVKSFSELTQLEIESLEKGFLGINTLNRIEDGLLYVKNHIKNMGYHDVYFEGKIWEKTNIFGKEDFERILEGINEIKKAFFEKDDTPNTPDGEYRYDVFNAIEKTINDFSEVIDDIVVNYRQCGEYICGG